MSAFKLKSTLAVAAMLISTGACGVQANSPQQRALTTPSVQSKPNTQTVNRLASLMVGVYTSREQALKDPENYRDVSLHMVRVWPERADGPWLYIEQALSTIVDRPYRQRMYRLVARPNGTIASEVYTLPEEQRFVGAWKDIGRFAALKPDSLIPRSGCAVVLKPQANGWAGSTVGRECPSDLYGAKFATSEVRVTGDRLESWDRGYDQNGEQVWGATEGPYVFLREPQP
jgi:CpeT protein